jgi:hypothetical protein
MIVTQFRLCRQSDVIIYARRFVFRGFSFHLSISTWICIPSSLLFFASDLYPLFLPFHRLGSVFSFVSALPLDFVSPQ